MTDIFLSYTREDQGIARQFAQAFAREGFTVWWDQALRSGEAYDKVTEKALEEAKAVVVLWSKRSVDSRWVRSEATQADRNKTLMPVMIESCKRPIMFELTHTADLSGWKGDPKDQAWLSFVNDVRRLVNGDESVAAATPAIAGTGARLPALRIALPVALLVIAGATLWWFTARNSQTSGTTANVTQAAKATTSERAATDVTLAVLPFANLSSDPEQDYFSDGLTEEILNQLAQVEGLAVTARTSSFSFKGKNEDVRTIGQKLGVRNLLEGSIRKDGKQLRITAQLVSGKDGAHLWSRTYDRELSDVFQLQEQLAKDVAQALSIKLDVGDTRRSNGGTTNLEAFDKYLQAGALLGKGYDKASATQALELSREAVALDPAFVRGWDRLAFVLGFMQVWTPDKAAALGAEAYQAIGHIMSLAPDSPQARRIRFGQLLGQRKWLDAAALVKSGAGAPGAQNLTLTFLVNTGRIEESIPILQRNCAQDPLSLACSAMLQNSTSDVGHLTEAQAEYQRSKGLVGAHIESDAIAMVRYGVGPPHPDPKILLSQFLAIMRDKNRPMSIDSKAIECIKTLDDARTVLRKALDDPANNQVSLIYLVAFWAGALGDRDLALTALQRAINDMHGGPRALWLQAYSHPGWRADPRFKQMVRDTGLADYFRASGNWGDFCKPVGVDDFECH